MDQVNLIPTLASLTARGALLMGKPQVMAGGSTFELCAEVLKVISQQSLMFYNLPYW